MRLVLKRKSTARHEDFVQVWNHIEDYVTESEVDDLIDQAVAEVQQVTAGKRVGYAWSGGKDSLALQVVMERAGINRGLMGCMPSFEFPEFMAWLETNTPKYLTWMPQYRYDLKWLAANAFYLFPANSTLGYWWTQNGTHWSQRVYYEREGLDPSDPGPALRRRQLHRQERVRHPHEPGRGHAVQPAPPLAARGGPGRLPLLRHALAPDLFLAGRLHRRHRLLAQPPAHRFGGERVQEDVPHRPNGGRKGRRLSGVRAHLSKPPGKGADPTLTRLLGFMGIALIWETVSRVMPHPFLPPLTAVTLALIGLLVSGVGLAHIASSLSHVVTGFAVASLLGITLGIGIALSPVVDAVVSPVADAVRPVAALTLFPLVILAFGLGLWSKVFVIFWTAWPAILLNTVQGLRKVDRSVLEAAQVDGAGTWPCFWSIAFPLALPTILTGLRIGLGGGWISLVAAEMLGASSGLGYAVLAYSQTFHFAEMYAVILLIAALGLAMNLMLAWLQAATDYSLEGA